MATDLASILDSAQAFTTQAQGAAKAVWDISGLQAVSASADASSEQQIGLNKQIIDGATQTANLATQQAKIKVANSLGANVKDSSEVITGLSSDILSLMSAKTAALKTISDKRSVGLFDDPLEFFFNHLTLPGDVAKHNAISAQLEDKEADLEKINQLTQSGIVTQNALIESITAAGIKASSDNIALTANMAANKASREALGYNAAGINAALNIAKESLGVQFSAQNAIQSQAHIGIALQQLDLQRQEFDWRKQEKVIADAARAKGDSADNYLLGRVNDGLKRMGIAEIPATSPKAGNIISLIKSGAAAGSIYSEALKISNDSEAAGGATILAPSPSRAIEVLSAVPGIKLSAAQEPVRDLLRTATQNVALDAQSNPTLNLKDPAQRSAALDAEAKKLLAQQASKIMPGDASNVFQIPDLGVMINSSPEMQKLPVVQKILLPAIAAGANLNDPNQVFGLVVKGLQNKTVNYNDAIELTSVYQRAVKTNLEAKQLQSLGLNLTPKLPTDPSIYSYNTPIQTDGTPTVFTGKSVVDLTKPDQVGRAMNKYLSSIAVRLGTSTIPGQYGQPLATEKPLLDRLFGAPPQ